MSASWPHLGRKEALHPRGPWCTVTQRRPTELAEFVWEKKSTITDNLFSPGRRIAARVFRHSSPSALLNNVSIPLAVIASRCHCLDVIEGLFHLLNSIGVAARGLGARGFAPYSGWDRRYQYSWEVYLGGGSMIRENLNLRILLVDVLYSSVRILIRKKFVDLNEWIVKIC